MSSVKQLIEKNIIKLIESQSRVLDLGCGEGLLLKKLKSQKNIQGYGVDINFNNILSSTSRGLSVIQGDIKTILSDFNSNSFDYVILSQTLQEVHNPLLILDEILRVGEKAIVTFPNFAYWRVRLQVMCGYAPKTKILPFEWYNTPNIRVITIKDFRNLCMKRRFCIEKEIPLYQSSFFSIFSSKLCSNFFSREGMFVLSKS